ncbi:MAG: septum site-determining protein MinC [Clostridia bacterium]|nr:septum site-determining protein MinC [Clostridia bacterium]MDD4047438.1 septum site-determining protein MinC [Clostridia bacterium]
MKNNIITIKGNREGLLIICDENVLWDVIIAEIKERLIGENGHFFKGASVIVNTKARTLLAEEVGELWKIFEGSGLKIKCIKTDTEKELSESDNDQQQIKEEGLISTDHVNNKPTLVIERNIRSGQNISFDGNILIFGDVNPGAEIKAVGFIIVMGRLRGIAHAGIFGDETAWIMSLKLQPTQLRIANYITRAPDEEPQKPEIARIYEGGIICEVVENVGKYVENIGGK